MGDGLCVCLDIQLCRIEMLQPVQAVVKINFTSLTVWSLRRIRIRVERTERQVATGCHAEGRNGKGLTELGAVQTLARPPPPLTLVLQQLTAQLAVTPLGTEGPVRRAGPALLQGAPLALGAVQRLRRAVATSLTGIGRRRRQGHWPQSRRLQADVQQHPGELLRGGERDEIIHHRRARNEGGFGGGDFRFGGGAVPQGGRVSSRGHPGREVQAAAESDRGQEGAAGQQGPVGAYNQAAQGTPLRPGGAGGRGAPLFAARVSLR